MMAMPAFFSSVLTLLPWLASGGLGAHQSDSLDPDSTVVLQEIKAQTMAQTQAFTYASDLSNRSDHA